ncbi:MAG: geranylgeranyl reductase family protein [Alicyclobacillus sp.]|nr:geranylgeranyl reductase family protein [Alicyclobacillus sp.]
MSTYPYVYDVIIVGAGPAGSTAARRLSSQGMSVLLLDKAIFPRYKVCGGGLTGRAASQLDIDISPVVRDAITQMELCCAGRYPHTFVKSDPFIYMVMRDEFDMLLLQAAIEAGVRFQPGTRVNRVTCSEAGVAVETDAALYHSRYIVGADGVNSTVAKQLNLMQAKRKILALEYEMSVDGPTLERFQGKVAVDYGFIDGGYAWVFPKLDHLSVGVGLGTRDGRFLQERLAAYLSREGIVGRFLSEKGFWLSVGASDTDCVRGRAALIGDAAGLVDPFMGEGIYYALRSANILADTLALGIAAEPDAPFARYRQRVEDELVREMQLFQRAARLFYAMPVRIHRMLVAHPKMVDHAFRVIAGETTFTDFYQSYRRNTLVRAVSAIGRMARRRDVR